MMDDPIIRARALLAEFAVRDGHPGVATKLRSSLPLMTEDGSQTVIDAMLAFAATHAPPPADAVARWLDERVDRETPEALAAFVDLYDDFTDFCALRGIAGDAVPAPIVFGRRIHEVTGAKTTIRRLPYRQHPARCLPFRLRDKGEPA